MVAENEFKEGEKVTWTYGGKEIPGVVKEKNHGDVEADTGKSTIKRKGDEENPAYVLAMDKGDSKDGKEVAKKGDKIQSREEETGNGEQEAAEEKKEEEAAGQEEQTGEEKKEAEAGEDETAAAKRKADAPPAEEEKDAKAAKADEEPAADAEGPAGNTRSSKA